MPADPRDRDLVTEAIQAVMHHYYDHSSASETRDAALAALFAEARRQAALDMRERCAAVAEVEAPNLDSAVHIAAAIRALEAE